MVRPTKNTGLARSDKVQRLRGELASLRAQEAPLVERVKIIREIDRIIEEIEMWKLKNWKNYGEGQ